MISDILDYVHEPLSIEELAEIGSSGPQLVTEHLATLDGVKGILASHLAEAPRLADQIALIEAEAGRLNTWLEINHPDPVHAFLHDLAEISRKHGLWIDGGRGGTPRLRPGWGDDKGYVPMVRDRGHGVRDIAFRPDSETEDWMRAPLDQRGPAPEAIQRVFAKRD